MRPKPPRLRPQWPLGQSWPHQHVAALSPFPQLQRRTLRSIQGKRPRFSRYNNLPDLPTLTATPAAALERKRISDTLPLRTGALAVKKGMTSVYEENTGKRIPATVLQIDRCQVIANKTFKRNGYFAVCLGEGWRQPRNVGRPMMGALAKSKVGNIFPGIRTEEDKEKTGIPPKRKLGEFRVRDENGLLPIGTSVTPSWFRIGQFVDTRSRTKGKGFAGGMKKWGWSGQPASHGVSLAHRSMGSAGGGQGSGSRVHPGKKMAGRMGGQQHTVQNLKVLMTDEENGLVVINGQVSGPNGCLVKIQDAIKKPWPEIPVEHPPSGGEAVSPLQTATG